MAEAQTEKARGAGEGCQKKERWRVERDKKVDETREGEGLKKVEEGES
jgi:hypothetical protein